MPADPILTCRLEEELEAVMVAVAAEFGACSNATADRVIAALDAARVLARRPTPAEAQGRS